MMGPMAIYVTAAAAATAQDAPMPVPPPAPPVVRIPAPPPMPSRPEGPNLPPTPRTEPSRLVSAFDYPASALREQRSGNTTVELAVNRWGRVADCTVKVSSGHADLDAAACERLATRATFWPATDAQGKPAPGTHTQTVRWALPEERSGKIAPPPPIIAVPAAPELRLFPRAPAIQNWGWARIERTDWPEAMLRNKAEGKVKVSFDLDETGAVTGCRVVQSSGHAALDAQSCAIARTRARFAPALGIDGQPIAGRGEQEFNWRIPVDRARPPAAPVLADRIARGPVTFPSVFAQSGQVAMKLAIGADGKATRCETSGAGGGIAVAQKVLDDMCREAKERGFRASTGGAPLPEAAEVTLDVKVTPRAR